MIYRILETAVDDNGCNGVYAFVLNIIKNISSDYCIDLCSFESFDRKSNIKYIEDFGGNVHFCVHIGNPIKKQLGCFKDLYHLVKSGHYNAVHIHSDVAYKLFLYAAAARLGGAKKVLIHSHSSGVEGKHRKTKFLLHYIARIGLLFVADYFFACSQKAAEWMYPQHILKSNYFSLINNGIDTKKFKFDPLIRNSMREKLNLTNNFVIGHIGRFSYQKNHAFLIDIFKEIVKCNHDAKLILVGSYVGDPVYLNETKDKIKKLGLEKNILFLGLRDDVPQLMQAMDCFVLPSRFEGLAFVGIESQAAGLPCFFSTKVTNELALTQLAHFISLEDSPEKWAKIILQKGKIERKDMEEQIVTAGHDVKREIHKLERIYQGDE